MAKVYSIPDDFPPVPEIGIRATAQEWMKAENEWKSRLAQYVRGRNPSCKLAGKVVSFYVADGSAQYMVWTTKPLALLHLPLGDAYQIPDAHARGLRVSDIKDQVKRSSLPNRW